MALAHAGALMLDVYGTLIDWQTGVADTLAPWAERNGLAAGRDALLEVFAARESARQAADPELRYAELLALVFEDIAAHFGVRAETDTAEAFGESVRDWPAFPDAPAALATLSRHARLAAVANTDRVSLNASVKRLGTAFEVMVTAEDAGAYKPDPAPFRSALTELSELGVGFDQIVHVAQSDAPDLAPAQALGLATCRIDRAGTAEPATTATDYAFSAMRAFADALAQARGAA